MTLDICKVTLKSGSHAPDSGQSCIMEAVAALAVRA